MMLLLTVACASDPKEVEEDPLPKEPSVLKIYVFAPDKPIVTRADIGDVDASADEAAINTLDVWVFNHDNLAERVGHVHLANMTWEGQKEISIELSDDMGEKVALGMTVDVYVVANATTANCGLTLNAETTVTQLNDALIQHNSADYFGLTSPVTSVPVEGLPMSGVLKEQVINGESPVFRVVNSVGGLATVRLVRAVSKVRFIFSQSVSNVPAISDLSISLAEGVLPTQEYLFLDPDLPSKKSHVGASYESAADLVTGITSEDIAKSIDPVQYVYDKDASESGQAYENRINEGLKSEVDDEGTVTKSAELSELGRFYLRESDKQLTGTINYKLGGVSKGPKTFTMDMAGDFTRNHTWIVYGYFLGSGDLVLHAVDVKAWTLEEDEHDIYNW